MSDIYSASNTSMPSVDTPMAYSKSTRTTVGRYTSWKSQPGVLSKQNFGSVLNFDEDNAGPQAPKSDKGASFGGY